ncbi:unnamed protein product [Brassicogethes aeneus]|uniref:Angiotensin-converting enzyme n=1 Tax=Brassicogethes aeneus TaxID=1431903 RepID=A0A9P0FGL1_BRAAE|nr:unnamed protein product [Brassicogethes aeneus]
MLGLVMMNKKIVFMLWWLTSFMLLRTSAQLNIPQQVNYPQRSNVPQQVNIPLSPQFAPNVYFVNNSNFNNRNFINNNRPYDFDFAGRGNAEIFDILQKIDLESTERCTMNVAAQWNFETNVNVETQSEVLHAQNLYSEYQHDLWKYLETLGISNRNLNFDTYRQLRYLSIVGPSALNPEQLDRYNRLINDMLSIYNTASICSYNDPLHCGMRLQPELTEIMAKSRNWEELQHVWTEWRRNSGRKMKDTFEQLAFLSNEAAQKNNFSDTSEFWNFSFDPSTDFFEEVWEEIKPLYELLHAYVRRRLRDFYGPDKISSQAPLPAHILGNMWAQSWTNILEITQPYPGQNYIDVTHEMNRQGYAPEDLFRLAEDFFLSINMSAMPLEFWKESIFEEPLDRVVVCPPSAWDFCNGRDYRIKMCSKITMRDLISAHHEVSHIQYFMSYKHQPKIFRDGANPAFHEAIGEAIGLSVITPSHLQSLGLIQNSVENTAVDINFLYSIALEKLAFLPFAYVMDKWRKDVFKGVINKNQYNCHWWILSEQYMGIKPPVLRSELDFDPGSKYHVPANIPYIRYFVSTVLQFQIYRSMCRASGQYLPGDSIRPLHKCDVYNHKEAGNILKSIMEKGASMPWREVLFQATGESRLDGSAMREYFQPLEEWLRNENLRTREYVGWLYDGDYCKQSIETAGLQVFGGFYNRSDRQKYSILNVLSLAVLSLMYKL